MNMKKNYEEKLETDLHNYWSWCKIARMWKMKRWFWNLKKLWNEDTVEEDFYSSVYGGEKASCYFLFGSWNVTFVRLVF